MHRQSRRPFASSNIDVSTSSCEGFRPSHMGFGFERFWVRSSESLWTTLRRLVVSSAIDVRVSGCEGFQILVYPNSVWHPPIISTHHPATLARTTLGHTHPHSPEPRLLHAVSSSRVRLQRETIQNYFFRPRETIY